MSRARPAFAFLLFFVVLLQVAPARARDGFALVLGGGGAKGFAHIGVIAALEELGVAPSMVVGTSMGAIIGSLYASGLDAATIEAQVDDRNWTRLLLDRSGPVDRVQGGWTTLPPAQMRLFLDTWPPALPAGASRGHAVESLVGSLTADVCLDAGNDFDRLPIPFRAVATDLVAARAVVFDHGPLPRLVRASGALPLVFVPVAYDGHFYLDGGFVQNLPLDVARDEGFERALVVDVSNAFVPLEEVPRDLVSLVRRATELAQRSENRIDPGPDDVVLRLDLRRYGTLSFYAAQSIIRDGYEAAMARRDEILALAAASGPAARRERPAPRVEPERRRIDRVEVVGVQSLSAWSVRKRLGVAAGDSLALSTLYARAEELSRQSIFESVWLELLPAPGGDVHVVAHVHESDRPELELAANYRDGIGPALLARLRLDNRFGAGGGRALSWRISPEHASVRLDTAVPIRGSRSVEFRLGGGWIRESFDVVRPADDTWDLRRGVVDAELVVARGLGQPALHLGVEVADGRRSLVSRDPAGDGRLAWRAVRIGLETWTGGGLGVWPSDGFALHARRGVEVAGGRSDAWSVEGGWVARPVVQRHWGLNTAAGGAWAARSLPVDLQARAGGPRGWLGQEPDSLVAPRLFWARLGFDVYLNREVRLELAGSVGWWGDGPIDTLEPRPGTQIQVEWDSALGPIRLGWAGGRGSAPRLVLDVGRQF